MERGMIFDIVRASFVDGPGIRTAVFFKGCGLRCRWCHNPEGQEFAAQMMFYKEKCAGCGVCERVCPHHLVSCDLCGECEKYCPNSARKLCGKLCATDEVMDLVERDRAFYDASGGGVTFTGGECMLQMDFLAELLKECRAAGIHTAVDTAGDVPFDCFERIMPYTDLFLYDVKCVAEELHAEWTGVSNRRILENLRSLSDAFEGDIIVRVPVVPTFNANEEEMSRIATLVNSLNVKKVELLPYHRLGESKYAALGRKAQSFDAPSPETMAKLRKLFEQ